MRDGVAAQAAAPFRVARPLLLTDVIGLRDKHGTLVPHLTVGDVARLQDHGTISGGMIPKLQTCVNAVQGGVEASVILDGRVPHALMPEIFTDRGRGTLAKR